MNTRPIMTLDDASRTYALLAVAIGAYVLALALPVVDDYPGWRAFRVTFSSIWPYEGFGVTGFDGWDDVISVVSASTNFLFIGATAWLLIARPPRSRPLVSILAVALLLDLYWFIVMGDERADLRAGYYYWILAFVALLVCAHLRPEKPDTTLIPGAPIS